MRKSHFAEGEFAVYCEAKEAKFNETFLTNNDFESININDPSVIDISDSKFTKCRHQNTELPYFVRHKTRFEECSIIRRPTAG